jgi:hypothetical protein
VLSKSSDIFYFLAMLKIQTFTEVKKIVSQATKTHNQANAMQNVIKKYVFAIFLVKSMLKKKLNTIKILLMVKFSFHGARRQTILPFKVSKNGKMETKENTKKAEKQIVINP